VHLVGFYYKNIRIFTGVWSEPYGFHCLAWKCMQQISRSYRTTRRQFPEKWPSWQIRISNTSFHINLGKFYFSSFLLLLVKCAASIHIDNSSISHHMVRPYVLTIIRLNTDTEGNCYRRGPHFTVDLLKYIIYYSHKRSNNKKVWNKNRTNFP
jgi:hypothetical protein